MNILKTSTFITCLLLLSGNLVIGQNAPGQLIINAGIGESPEFNGDIGTILSPGKMFPIGAL